MIKDNGLQPIEEYTYDANGNRLTADFDSAQSPVVATYDAQDRMLTYGYNVYTYTPNGSLLTKSNTEGTTEYSYDAMGNLLRVKLPDNRIITYQIDARGRRIGKKVDGVFQYGFIYGDQLNPIAKVDIDKNIIEQYVYGLKGNVPEYLIKGNNKYKIVSNHLGSPVMIINMSDNSVAKEIEYDSFGNILEDSAPGFELAFRFAGGTWDKDTKLVRFGVRDYDSETGRWTSKEPLGFGGARNFYVYSDNDGVGKIDLTGLVTKIWIWEHGPWYTSSKYGHVNISINNYMFNFTKEGFQVYDLNHYLSMQKRNATIVALDLDASKESILEEKLIFHNEHQDYGLFFDWKADEWTDFTCIDSVRKPLYELYNEDSRSVYNFPKTTKDGVKFPSDFLMELIDSQIEILGFQYFTSF